ncbi:MAG TPA: hypothetical protein VK618_01680 [Flavitalea sp.]|nr:hypothetical protein [Flavitalea sp.]
MNFFDTIFKYTRGILAFIIVILTFAFLFALLAVNIPENNKDILNISVGFVLGVIGTVASYYFGTSKDKSDSDQSKIFPKEPPNP